jgi:hypothetical protein
MNTAAAQTTNAGRVPGFAPENDLEAAAAADPDIERGWAFPVQGAGHPEPDVGAHVAAILANIGANDEMRAPLRFIALVHDSMKWSVRDDLAWSPDNDHAVLARRVAERHTSDPRLLQTIELHDEAYWLFRRHRTETDALDGLLARLPDTELYLRFVELDGSTFGKELTFLLWLRHEFGLRGLLPTRTPEMLAPHRGGRTTLVVEWETDPDNQAGFAAALASTLTRAAASAVQWEHDVFRSTDGARVLVLGHAPMPPDTALIRGRIFAQRVAEEVDHTGVRMLEARTLVPVEPQDR